MKRTRSSAKTRMIGRPSTRWKIDDCGELRHDPASRLMLQVDQIFGELDHRHVLRTDLAHDAAAVEHDQAVGDLVHVREIVLDVDAGAARTP